MHRCESWTVKKAECQRIDAFEPWCWRRLLRVPWTARRSSQSILKKINPEYSLGGQMLKLKLRYFGHLMQRAGSLGNTQMMGKIEGRKATTENEMVGWHHQMDMSLSKLREMRRWWRTGKPGVLQSTGSQRVGHNPATEQQSVFCRMSTCSVYMNYDKS